MSALEQFWIALALVAVAGLLLGLSYAVFRRPNPPRWVSESSAYFVAIVLTALLSLSDVWFAMEASRAFGQGIVAGVGAILLQVVMTLLAVSLFRSRTAGGTPQPA